VSDHGCPSVQLGDSAQIDRECQYDLLTFAQAEIGGLDEHSGGAQIHRLAQLSAATRNGYVDNGSCTVPRVQAAFHLNEPRVILLVVRRDLAIMPSSGPAPCTAST
jgi:hypothetical protein